MRITSLLFIFALLFTALPAQASKMWRGDMLANAQWNEGTQLESMPRFQRRDDMFRHQGAYWRPDADMFDHHELRHAPRTDMFRHRRGARPDQKLFNENF